MKKTFEDLSHKVNIVRIDADKIAREIGNPKASNMVMLGAASPFINIHNEIIVEGIKTIFKPKGNKIVEMNILAFNAGKKFAGGKQ